MAPEVISSSDFLLFFVPVPLVCFHVEIQLCVLYLECVCVSQDCSHKVLYAGASTANICFSCFWRLAVQGQGTSRFGVREGLLPGS